ncbi:MAG TPA: Fe-S cluster assembly protein SufD, partial [Tepidisphaeraceae bacterium]|nr:Fe-S cluster assembly protein SufD [Tepidisphaeraceae bacterium]
NETGYPGRRDEEWRFTNVDPIAKTKFALAPRIEDASSIEAATQFSFGRDAVSELVFINGHYTPQLSKLGKLPRGVKVQSLAEALSANPAELKSHLSKHADINTNPFVALNTGHIHDGAYIHFPRGATVEGAIHLLFVSVPTPQPTVTHPRILVIAEENVEATLVESYVGEGSGGYFTNTVTEIIAASDSRIDHCKLQQESHEAYHLSAMQVHLGRSAHFVTHGATIGGKLSRNEINVTLAGEYADATLNGLVLLDGARHCDNHTLLDHAAANCPSHELFKHVLGGKSTGVFKGKILVRPDSQKTDSKQTSKTLLLSDDAIMDSMPALEIYADDVKCTHGSTTGPVDEEQVFYLRSRGVSHEAARHLLTYAFAADITRRIRVEPVRARIENFMAAQHGLPLDLRIADLGAHDEAVVNI